MAGEDLEQLIEQFVTVTSTSSEIAEQYIVKNNFSLSDAIEDFFGNGVAVTSPGPSGSTSRANNVPKSKIKSFSDLNHNDDQSSDDDTNLFTGGEKSALQVENPDKNNSKNLVRDLLKKAEETGAQEEKPKEVKKFTGTGFKLGSEDSPSVQIPDPTAHLKKLEKVTRNITFWKDGFQVGAGKLYRYDDPSNESILDDLNRGSAPLSLLDVKFGQEVEVNVTKNLDEAYTPPKRKIGGYAGSGYRLGSPVPGEFITEPKVEEPAVVKKEAPKNEVEGAGDSTIQIRLANGERKIHKFNSSDPVSKVYEYVESVTTDSRSFILSHAFPVKPIEKNEATIKESGLINSVIIQRWA